MTEAAVNANMLVGVAENDITPPLGTQLAGYFAPRDIRRGDFAVDGEGVGCRRRSGTLCFDLL